MQGLDVPVFHPTLKNVQGSWEDYVETIEKRTAKVGIAKVIPPKGWTPRRNGYADDLDWVIPRPVRQDLHGSLGIWKATQVEGRTMNLVDGFRPVALRDVYKPGRNADASLEAQEKNYWQTVSLKEQLYGADVPGSLFDPELKVGF
jgi:jumonji domain-containing protein 2